MTTPPIESTIAALLASGKGVLAADESTPTIKKRFDTISVESTVESRRDYRELLFTTKGLNAGISGAILYDETLRQQARDGRRLVDILRSQNIVPGIKVDEGTVALPGFANQKITEGLDGLAARLAEYVELGARFTKWRAVFSIAENSPSLTCLRANAQRLALFAALSQEAGLVPLVEPEILMDGAHDLARSEEVATETLSVVFETLRDFRVSYEKMLLKTGMVLAGKACAVQADPAQIAAATLRCFARCVPAAVPGILFLSGGQSPDEATTRLRAICSAPQGPWQLSFSYGRALQAPVLEAWKGEDKNKAESQDALHWRAVQNGLALHG